MSIIYMPISSPLCADIHMEVFKNSQRASFPSEILATNMGVKASQLDALCDGNRVGDA